VLLLILYKRETNIVSINIYRFAPKRIIFSNNYSLFKDAYTYIRVYVKLIPIALLSAKNNYYDILLLDKRQTFQQI